MKDLEAANKAQAEELAKAKSDLESAKAESAKKPEGGEVTLEKPVDMTSGGKGGAEADSGVHPAVRAFADAKSIKIKMGMNAAQAHEAVCLENPALAQKYMEAEAEAFAKAHPNRAFS
jgi:phenylalanyl-tRNA synthetase alpha subunit